MAQRGRPFVEAHHAEFPFGRATIRRRRVDVRNTGNGSTQIEEDLATGVTSIDVNGGVADAMRSAQIRDRYAGLVLLQDPDDQFFGEPVPLHLWSFQLGQSLTQTGLAPRGNVTHRGGRGDGHIINAG